MAADQDRQFTAPGPGSWTLNTSHFIRPMTRFFTENYSDAYAQAWRRSLLRYGALLDRVECRFVNGLGYMQLVPALQPPGPLAERVMAKLPTALLRRVATLIPELRRRAERCAKAFADKLWREDLQTWDQRDKPAAIRAHVGLLASDPATMTNEVLARHLEDCEQNFRQMVGQHHFYNATTIIPTGDFLCHAQDWTGLPIGRLLGLLKGTSPASAGSIPQLVQLAAALRGSPQALALVTSAAPPAEIVARLREVPGEIGAHMADYVAIVGYRPVNGYDIVEPYALEMPELLVYGIRQALEPPRLEEGALQQLAAVRDAVPAAHRPQFDELLAEARLVYRIRDERDLYSDTWAAGVARRAILAAGARAVQAGRIAAIEDIFDASVSEMRQLLLGEAGAPSGAELCRRAEQRAALTLADAPPVLGEPPAAPPPLDFLPPQVQRLTRAVEVYQMAALANPPAQTERKRVRGVGASAGVYEGVVRKIMKTSELGRIAQGDVLVTEATGAAFNVVLPLLGAIVTNRGGVLSHAAIMAREYGIPAVVGTTDATQILPDGARVRVDGGSGEARILE